MAKSGWTRSAAACLFPRGGDALCYAIAVLSIVSLLSYELSRHSVLAADFEGFEEEDEDFSSPPLPDFTSNTPLSPLPTTLTQSSPESDHGPPQSEESAPPIEAPKSASMAEEWDEDEFEGIPTQTTEDSSSSVLEKPSPEVASAKVLNDAARASFFKRYGIEVSCISFLIAFLINYFTRKKENEQIALAWASRFATKDSIFDKNFSLLGTGDGKDTPLLLKEASDCFKFYASGRRFCQGLLATMDLRSRHDLISRVLDLVLPKQDTITFEVVMNDEAMDQVVFAVAKKKLAKAMQKDERDLQRFASVITTPPAGRKWVPDDLLVVSESKEVAGDLITEAVLEQVFGEKSFKSFGKGFISMHFSDYYQGSSKKLLLFKFLLPDAKNMADMTRLVTLIPYYIDLVGRYKLSPQAKSKTESARASVAKEAYKELQNARQEALQRKKADKKKFLEAEAKLNAEALRKKEEKERARQLKKSMPRVKMVRT
ncbi:uncharacterized protein At5g49945 [Wolffia australiana]